MKTLCIEGWRGVNHSFAMVNQNQILEMLKLPGWEIYHRDAPYFMPHWKDKAQFTSGFAPEEQARIDALPEPGDMTADCCLRIAYPVSACRPERARRTCTFVVTEMGLSESSFNPSTLRPEELTRGEDIIITPSTWARERLVEWGFDGDKVRVVPHGFKTDVFRPPTASERAEARRLLGIGAEEIVFAHVGVSTWNKGIDLLLLAFAELRARGRPVRLLLKDHKKLYGIGVETLYNDIAKRIALLDEPRVRAGISILTDSLSLPQLRSLYMLSDAYVSPYRAEGFNMPVLEAMGCGTHVITSRGGPTDDFVPEALAYRIQTRRRGANDNPEIKGAFVIPDLEDLIHAMEEVVQGRTGDPQARAQAREALALNYSWSAVTRQLMAVLSDSRATAGEPLATVP